MRQVLYSAIYSLLVFSSLGIAPKVSALPENHDLSENYLNDLNITENDSLGLDQVTNVNQLRDVSLTDWAYNALRSLVERYDCLVGYPNQTYSGNKIINRYEFAAGLNACLEEIERLIASSEALRSDDLKTINKLRQEFAVELAVVTEQVDDLETRTAFLEDVQFSPTTKLRGRAIFGLTDWFSGAGEAETVLQNEVSLRVVGSFSGKDLLEVSANARNTISPNFDTPNNGINVGSTNEGRIFTGRGNNNLSLGTIDYTFPLIDNSKVKSLVTVFANRRFTSGGTLFGSDALLWLGPGKPISNFANRSPIYSLSGRSGVLVRFKISDKFRIGGTYSANPGSDPNEGGGLFDSNYFAAGQMVITPSDKLFFTMTYANTFSRPGQFKFSRGKQNPNSPGLIGTALANRFDNAGVFFDDNISVIANVYGLKGFYQINPLFNLGGFVTKIDARLIGRGDADIWSYAVVLSLTDLFKEGNIGGLIVGVEPYLADIDARVDIDNEFKNDTSLHIEAYYRYQLNKNLAITPGVVWITAPNQDADNEDIIVGVLETVFSF
ncbi:MAG: iron uptake porin [Xenococcus sp. (in: cyanobacteria)]